MLVETNEGLRVNIWLNIKNIYNEVSELIYDVDSSVETRKRL